MPREELTAKRQADEEDSDPAREKHCTKPVEGYDGLYKRESLHTLQFDHERCRDETKTTERHIKPEQPTPVCFCQCTTYDVSAQPYMSSSNTNL